MGQIGLGVSFAAAHSCQIVSPANHLMGTWVTPQLPTAKEEVGAYMYSMYDVLSEGEGQGPRGGRRS